jgi:hypothetical protein
MSAGVVFTNEGNCQELSFEGMSPDIDQANHAKALNLDARACEIETVP